MNSENAVKKLGADKAKKSGRSMARRGAGGVAKSTKPAVKKKPPTARKTGPKPGAGGSSTDSASRRVAHQGDDAAPSEIAPDTTVLKMTKRAGDVLFAGKHLQLVSRGGWECCERTKATGVVTIVAVTADRRLLLTEQFRPPVGRNVIELPAGLAGDEPGGANEALAVAARRELLEETGYECDRMEFLTEGPSSAGMSSEILTFFRATEIRQVATGGGVGSEKIELHTIPLSWIRGWLREREAAGSLVDPKVYAGLYFLGAT